MKPPRTRQSGPDGLTYIMVDYKNIVHGHKLDHLEKHVHGDYYSPGTIPRHVCMGLVLAIPTRVEHDLASLPPGLPRVQFLNSDAFIQAIDGYAFAFYDKMTKICEIIFQNTTGSDTVRSGRNSKDIQRLVETLMRTFPGDTMLVCKVDRPDHFLLPLIDNGFANPFRCGRQNVFLTRPNTPVSDNATLSLASHRQRVLASVRRLADNNTDAGCPACCALRVQLSPETITYFHLLSDIGVTLNKNQTMSQKEISGWLIPTQRVRQGRSEGSESDGNDGVWHLGWHENQTTVGSEETVASHPHLFTYHSHPREAYERHGVHVGWPSPGDYISFFDNVCKYGSAMHIVVAREGLYVLSLDPAWVRAGDEHGLGQRVKAGSQEKERLQQELFVFIRAHFAIDKTEQNGDIDWYITTVNNARYRGRRVFEVRFLPWSRATQVLAVVYSKKGKNCFVDDVARSVYQRFCRQ